MEQVNKHLKDTYLSLTFNSEDSPRKYRVVLAVMQKKWVIFICLFSQKLIYVITQEGL